MPRNSVVLRGMKAGLTDSGLPKPVSGKNLKSEANRLASTLTACITELRRIVRDAEDSSELLEIKNKVQEIAERAGRGEMQTSNTN